MPGWWNGIHEGLKILWSYDLVGSNPAPGTINKKSIGRLIFCLHRYFRDKNLDGPGVPVGTVKQELYHCTVIQNPPKGRILFEAWARVALAHKGFADLCLATWLPGHKKIKILLFPLSYLV